MVRVDRKNKARFLGGGTMKWVKLGDSLDLSIRSGTTKSWSYQPFYSKNNLTNNNLYSRLGGLIVKIVPVG